MGEITDRVMQKVRGDLFHFALEGMVAEVGVDRTTAARRVRAMIDTLEREAAHG